MVVNGKVFTLEPDIGGADDEIFLELAQASVGSGFLTANAMATMIYDIPALPGLDTKVGYPVQRGSQSDQRV
jgi:hypothetical protein